MTYVNFSVKLEKKIIGLAKKFIQVFPLHLMGKPERLFGQPNPHNISFTKQKWCSQETNWFKKSKFLNIIFANNCMKTNTLSDKNYQNVNSSSSFLEMNRISAEKITRTSF